MSTTKKKIQLVLDDEAVKTLSELQAVTGASTMTEVLRDALGVYSSLRELLSRSSGTQLAIVDKSIGEFQELTIPSFQRTPVVAGLKSALGVRDEKAAADPGAPHGDCSTDGHYMCDECKERATCGGGCNKRPMHCECKEEP